MGYLGPATGALGVTDARRMGSSALRGVADYRQAVPCSADGQRSVADPERHVSLTQNGIARRCDTVVADHTGQPLVIVEYKAPSIKITQKTFDQIVRYNMVLHARYLIVSNGMNHYCCQIDYENNKYQFLENVPVYNEL